MDSRLSVAQKFARLVFGLSMYGYPIKLLMLHYEVDRLFRLQEPESPGRVALISTTTRDALGSPEIPTLTYV